MTIFLRADLVPVYSFGENELFKQVILSEGSLGRRLQDLFKKVMGFAPCLFVGERFVFLPYRTPVTTVGEYQFSQEISLPCPEFRYMFCFLLQWEVLSQCQSVWHPQRRKWTTTTNFTWRA